MNDIAPGYRSTTGKRNPPDKGQRYYVQLRNGMCPAEPWPAGRTKSGQTRWVWGPTPDPFDIIAIRNDA